MNLELFKLKFGQNFFEMKIVLGTFYFRPMLVSAYLQRQLTEKCTDNSKKFAKKKDFRQKNLNIFKKLNLIVACINKFIIYSPNVFFLFPLL